MNWTTNFRRVLALASVLLVAASGVAYAQAGSGNIYGKVTDNEGQPLPGVTVSLSGGGAPALQVTDAQGLYRFLGVYPGSYKIEANLEGFSPVVYENARVSTGVNTTINLTMSGAVEETITITGESPLLDERKISTTSVINSTELEKIPTARDPWVILQTTPGVQIDRVNVGGNESGQQSVYVGNGDANNSTWAIDGVEITDVGALGSSPGYHDFDAFEEMQVSTGGSDSSLRTGGVAMNMVTKRGTNEWRGSARYLLADDSWQSSTGFDDSELAPGQAPFKAGNRIVEVEDQGLEVGGPLWKDHIWVWGSYGEQTIDLLTAADTPDLTTLETYNGKFNWQIVPSNSFTASFSNNDKIKIGRNASPTRPPETTWNQGGFDREPDLALIEFFTNTRPTLAKLEDTHVFGSNFFVTAMYAEVSGGFSLTPQGGIGADHVNAIRGIDGVWHNTYLDYFTDRPSEQYKADASYFMTTGEVNHELKFGAYKRDSIVLSTSTWPGYGYAVSAASSASPNLYIGIIGGSTSYGYEATWENWYAQDTLTWGNFTVNVGLRQDKQEAAYVDSCSPAAAGFEDLVPSVCFRAQDLPYSWDSISPRIGMTYALGEERKTLLRASYSRFADQLGGTSILSTHPLYYGPAFYTLAYDYNEDLDLTPDEHIIPLGPNASLNGRGPDGFIGQAVDFQSDPGLDAPTTDELVLAVEHALLPEFVVGAQVVYRQNKDILYQDLLVFDGDSIDDASYGGRRATRSDYVLYETVPVNVPGAGVVNHDIYGLREGVSTRGGSFLYNSDREQEYLGISVTANKRLSNQWSLRGNLTWNDWSWKIPSSAISDPNNPGGVGGFYAGGNQDGDRVVLCSGGSGAKGGVCLSSEWNLNLTGMYQVMPDKVWGFNVSGSLNAREGYAAPYSYLSDRPDLPAEQVTYLVTDRPNDQKLDDLYTLDLRVEKEFQFADFGLTLGADCFNALNEGTVLQRRLNLNSSGRDRVDEVLSPRIFRLGARLSFR